GVWAQPYGVRTARRGDSAGDRWDTTIGGVSGGIDYRLRGDGVRDGLLLGLSFGYARADTGYRELTDATKSRAYQAGLYGGWWQGPWSVDAGLGFALNRYESRRDLNFGTTKASAEGRYDGREYSAYAEGRYRHEIAVGGPGVLELLPLAGVQALRLRTDGYTETGAGAMNLNVAADTVSSLRTSLGAAMAYPMALSDGRSLRPELRARWSHEFGDTDAAVDASFAAAGGAAFQVASEELGRDAALLGAGLEARLSPRLSLAAAYDLQWQQGYTAQAVTGRVRVAF
ncbi:MAG: autotransporter outer membrane beta-barrel domain-containing protein, partial [Sneathiellaceae bacterium]